MPNTMLAVVKAEPAPGTEIREVPKPQFGPTDVFVKVEVASICGTDLHIYQWDQWAQHRIHPPLIPGHEFCGTVEAVGHEVTSVRDGDFVSAEMHVACGKCLQCRIGEAHICQNVKIIGVDANGAFAEYVVIPESNIWKLDASIPREYASILDPLEVNEHRRKIAKQMGPDFVLDPTRDDVYQIVMDNTGGTGVDVVLEMAGRTEAIRTGFKILRLGGRMSLLGIPSRPVELNLAEEVIFKGATIQGINGRRMYQTWYQMTALLKAGKLDLHPVITNRIAMKDFASGMELLKTGEASKILVYPNGTR
jgi:threonine 3-dehydrogenase